MNGVRTGSVAILKLNKYAGVPTICGGVGMGGRTIDGGGKRDGGETKTHNPEYLITYCTVPSVHN